MIESSKPFRKPNIGDPFDPEDFCGIRYVSKGHGFRFSIEFFSEEAGGWFGAHEAILEWISPEARGELEAAAIRYYGSVREILVDRQRRRDQASAEISRGREKRRTRRMKVGYALRMRVFTRDGFTCQYCGRKPPEVQIQPDHVLPVAKGGADDIDNLVTACKECNGGKGAKTVEEIGATEVVCG